MRRFRPLLVLLLTAALTVGAAASASASATMQVGIADDGVTQRVPSLAPTVIPQWAGTGVDVARVLAIWSYVAPQPQAAVQPAGFDASNPDDPQYSWGTLDQTIDLLVANGIKPVVAITGWGPVWGSTVPAERNPRYKPDPQKFAQFATAVARRYGSRVDTYIVWNEPNVAFWLQPQFNCVGKSCTPASPAIYRNILKAARPAILAADPGATVLAGALAPRGSTPAGRNYQMRPLLWLRSLGCVDSKLRKDRRSASCKGFTPATADGIAYHPHNELRDPTQGYPNADDAGIADIPRLLKTVDAVQQTGGLINGAGASRKFNLYFTEFGYQTNPPDPYLGVTLAQQNAWLQESDYLAWRQPRVKMLIQYLWRDDPVGNKGQGAKAYAGWQSGLYFYDGRAKPSRVSFPNPLWVDLPKGRRTATIWGQVRRGGAAQVTVQRKLAGKSTYTTIKTLTTNAQGFFAFTTTVNAKASFRYSYTLTDAATGATRTVTTGAQTVAPTK